MAGKPRNNNTHRKFISPEEEARRAEALRIKNNEHARRYQAKKAAERRAKAQQQQPEASADV